MWRTNLFSCAGLFVTFRVHSFGGEKFASIIGSEFHWCSAYDLSSWIVVLRWMKRFVGQFAVCQTLPDKLCVWHGSILESRREFVALHPTKLGSKACMRALLWATAQQTEGKLPWKIIVWFLSFGALKSYWIGDGEILKGTRKEEIACESVKNVRNGFVSWRAENRQALGGDFHFSLLDFVHWLQLTVVRSATRSFWRRRLAGIQGIWREVQVPHLPVSRKF